MGVIGDVFKLYVNKSNPKNKKKKLNEIFIKNFDTEQIWQQMELKNELFESYVPTLAKLLASEAEIKLPYCRKSDLSNNPSIVDCSNEESGIITAESYETCSEEDDDEEKYLVSSNLISIFF